MVPRLIARFFPNLAYEDWGYVDVNDIATDLCELLQVGEGDSNPFLIPEVVDKWMGFIHKMKEIKYSWGGYLEDRAILWRGHYHKPGETVHLGVDVNVPANTKVCMPVWGKLVHSFKDPDQNGGWGGKLIFETEQGFLVLGHLKDIPDDIGTKYSPGQEIGTVAEEDCNGGWAPHLHIQLMKNFVPNVDGYAALYEGIENDYLDPINVWKK